MPGIGGIEATRRIVAAQPDVAVLVLSLNEADIAAHAAIRAGAKGYTAKGARPAEIIAAVLAAAAR